MKAENLMIGDWVLAEGIPLQVTNISVLGGDIIRVMNPIMSYDIPYASNIIALSNGAKDINKIEPIPLTEEILEKNGFKKDFEHNFIYWRQDCRKFCIVKELDTWYFAFRVLGSDYDKVTNEIKTSGYICISECNYVHNFQHLLRNLGIEKEIVL